MLVKVLNVKRYKKILLAFCLIVFLISVILISYKHYDLFSVNAYEWTAQQEDTGTSYIKWVDCNLTLNVMNKTSKLDIDSHVKGDPVKLNWIELISYLACKYGNDFKSFKQKDLDDLVSKLENGSTMAELTQNMKNYNYYYESYSAILSEFIGEYEIQVPNDNGEITFEKRYGIKAFSPIAKGYSFSHYDDFGQSRSYGYKREHLGNDLMGSIGTPIIAVESGVAIAAAWNQYGGWRIGIRSFDGKRYYYYAHLRKNAPFAADMYEGKVVKAGDVIGYLGMTGYSTTENVNNINVPHLHFGMQLIFDESQKDGTNQIWIDVYTIVNFLQQNKSEVYKIPDTKEYQRKYDFMEPDLQD